MQISVVIPVYNAAAFVREAVESALAQPETAEVVLVEDGSPDGSLAVCEELAATHGAVLLYRHPNGENRGAGATRNLGILHSRFEFVAFLDADDFYLADRFGMPRQILEADPVLEGVYEAVGTHVEDQAGLAQWESHGKPADFLTTVSERVAPERLLAELCLGELGHFHLDGLVVKRSVFERTGPFDEHLRLHQDTAMMYKLAAVARLAPGSLEQPVAMRRVHAQNRISAPRSASDIYEKRMLLFETLWEWAKANLSPEQERMLLELYLRGAIQWAGLSDDTLMWKMLARYLLAKLPFRTPALLREPLYWLCFLPGIDRRMKTARFT